MRTTDANAAVSCVQLCSISLAGYSNDAHGISFISVTLSRRARGATGFRFHQYLHYRTHRSRTADQNITHTYPVKRLQDTPVIPLYSNLLYCISTCIEIGVISQFNDCVYVSNNVVIFYYRHSWICSERVRLSKRV